MYYTIGGELYHHGILGQRWGKQNGPPYPLGTGDHSTAERNNAKRGVSTLAGYLSSRKKKKQQKKALEKARAAKVENAARKKAAEEHEANKQKVLQSGSAADVMKYKGELSNEELNKVLQRLNYEKQLGELSSKDVKTASDKIDSVINKIDKVRGWTEKGVSAYNTAAKIINTFSSSDTELPIIKEGSKNERKNRELDLMVKKLQAENQKLKNEGERIKNEGESLKNNQTRINQEKQIAKDKEEKQKKEKQQKEINKKEKKEKANKFLKRIGIKS